MREPAEGQRQCAAASVSGAHGACNESESESDEMHTSMISSSPGRSVTKWRGAIRKHEPWRRW